MLQPDLKFSNGVIYVVYVSANQIEVSVTDSKNIMDIILTLNPQLQKLDIQLLEPYLNQYDVLTPNNRQYLQLDKYTNIEKMQYLVTQLESKAEEAQKGFIKAIYESSQESGGGKHREIIKLFQDKGITVTPQGMTDKTLIEEKL